MASKCNVFQFKIFSDNQYKSSNKLWQAIKDQLDNFDQADRADLISTWFQDEENKSAVKALILNSKNDSQLNWGVENINNDIEISKRVESLADEFQQAAAVSYDEETNEAEDAINENNIEEEKQRIIEESREYFNKKLQDLEYSIFGSQKMPLNTYRANFRMEVCQAFLFHQVSNFKRITYTTEDFNRSIVQYKNRLYNQLISFLGGQGKFAPVFDFKWRLKQENMQAVIDAFQVYMTRNRDSLRSELIQSWKASIMDDSKQTGVSVFQAVQAYLTLTHFDDLVGAELGGLVSIDPSRRDAEQSMFDEKGNVINKYSIGRIGGSGKATFGQEFSDAMAQVGKVSKLMIDAIPKLSAISKDHVNLKESLKISDFGVAWNQLKIAISRLQSSLDRDEKSEDKTLKKIQKEFDSLLDNPNEHVYNILKLLSSITTSPQITTRLMGNGCSYEHLNVLYSVYNFLQSVAQYENKEVQGESPSNSKRVFDRGGIHNCMRQQVLMNLLFQISPANYLETNLTKTNSRTDYIQKATSIYNRQRNYLDNMRTSMFKYVSSERKSRIDGRAELVLNPNAVSNDGSYKNADTQLILHLKLDDNTDVHFVATALNHSGLATSLFGNFEKVSLKRILSEDQVKEIKNVLEENGIDIGTNLYGAEVLEKIKNKIEELKGNPDQHDTVERLKDIQNNYLSDFATKLKDLSTTTASGKQILSRNSNLNKLRYAVLDFIGDMLDLPITSDVGIQTLFQVINDKNGLSINNFLSSAMRITAAHLSMSEYQDSIARSQQDGTELKYKNFLSYFRDRFSNVDTLQSNMRRFGGDATPEPIIANETWTNAWFTAEAAITGTSYPATTKNAEKNNVANFRSTSLASSYSDVLATIRNTEQHAARNTLFVNNTSAIVSQGYDTQVITANGNKKLVKRFTQKELIYHQIAHNFFNGYVKSNVFYIQPTVYSDKTAFVLYTINAKHIFSNKYKNKEGKALMLHNYSEDQFIDLYTDTVGSYWISSFEGTLSQLKNLILSDADERVQQRMKFHPVETINEYLNSIDERTLMAKVYEYNKKLDQLLFEINHGLNKYYNQSKAEIESEYTTGKDGKSIYDSKEDIEIRLAEERKKILKNNGFNSDRRIQLSKDADYRTRKSGGKEHLSLVEIGLAYYQDAKSYNHVEIRRRMRREMQRMIRDLIKYNVNFSIEPDSILFELIHSDSSWIDGQKQDDFLNKWKNIDGNIIYAYGKNKNGKEIAITSLSQLDSYGDIEINPIFKKYFYIENILGQNLRYALIGSEVADPDKVSHVSAESLFSEQSKYYPEIKNTFSQDEIDMFKGMDMTSLFLLGENEGLIDTAEDANKLLLLDKIRNDARDRIISSCEGAQYKRNVIVPATMFNMSCNIINGLGSTTKVAIIDDTRANCFNIKGEDSGIDAHDGSGIRTPQQADLENNSLGDQASGYDLAKTIWHYNDPLTGKSFLAKWAVFTLTNSRMQNSADSEQQGLKLYKRMTNALRWDGLFDLCNSRLVSEDGNTELNFGKDILSTLTNDLYYQDRGKVYKIIDFKRQGNFYYTIEQDSQSDSTGVDYACVTLFDKDSNEIRLRYKIGVNNKIDFNDAIEIEDLIRFKGYHTIGSNYEIYQAMGGLYCVNSFYDLGVSENSHHAVTAFLNNVYSEKEKFGSGVNQEKYKQPLKEMQIGYATNKSAIKRLQLNCNPQQAWNGDTELNYAVIDNKFLGKQGDPDHEADDSEVSEMTQVIASLDVGGATHTMAKQAFQALGRLTADGMKLQTNLLAQALSKDTNKSPEQIASSIYHIIGKILYKNFRANNNINLGQTILQSIKREFQKQGMNDHLSSDIEKFIPFSDPNIFSEMIKSITGELNNLALKRKYKGIGSVLVPGYNVIQMYHLNGVDSGMFFNDVLDLANNRHNINDISQDAIDTQTVLDGNVISRFYTTNRDYSYDNIDTWQYGYNVRLTNDSIEIDGQFVKSIDKHQKISIMLAILNNVKPGQAVKLLNMSNEDVAQFQQLGLNLDHNGLYTYRPLSQYEYNRKIVHAFLENEQHRNVYIKPASYFQPEDHVNILSNNELIGKISLDELHKYYEFKHLFVISDIEGRRKAILDRMRSEFELNEISEEQLQEYIDANFKSIANSFYDGLITYEDEGYNKEEIENMKDPFAKYLRLSLFDNLTFQEDIVASSNLRPQRIQFKLENGEYANIYDINASEDLYLINTRYYKYRQASQQSENVLRQQIQNSTKSLSSETNKNTISVYGVQHVVDKSSVEIRPAEAIMSNIYSSKFSQGNRSMYQTDRNFKPQTFDRISLPYADFQLCTSKKHLSFILGNYNLFKSSTFKFSKIPIAEDIIQNNDQTEIWAINETTTQPTYKIGRYVKSNDIVFNKKTNSFESLSKPNSYVNQLLYVQQNGKVYKKEYFLTKYRSNMNGHQEYFIQFNKNVVNAEPDYIQRTIQAIKEDEGYQWIQLNGSLKNETDDNGNSHLSKIQGCLQRLSELYDNSTAEKSFRISLDKSIEYLGNLDKKLKIDPVDNKFIYIYKQAVRYGDVLSKVQIARAEYQKASYEASKYIISARIPAQNLSSFMSMKTVGYLPINTNQVIVSHFQTWLQGSDYDIDKSYIMAYQFSDNGVFESWSPLFDYTSGKTLHASMVLNMPLGNQIKISATGLNINSDILNIVNLDREIKLWSTKPEEQEFGKSRVLNGVTEIITTEDKTQLSKKLELEYIINSEETDLSKRQYAIVKANNGKNTPVNKATAFTIEFSNNADQQTRLKIYRALLLGMPMKLDKHLPKNKIIQFVVPKDTAIEDVQLLSGMCDISTDENGNIIARKKTAKYIENLKVQRIKSLATLIDKIDSNADNSTVQIKELDENISQEGNEILKEIQNHEDYKIPQSKYQAAHKNFLATRIYNISSDPRNMLIAYTPVTVDPLHKAANKVQTNEDENVMTSMNPITKAIMQYQNMDGKEVIGIAAVGERVFMGLTYYNNEGINSTDNLWHTYMKFFHHTTRIQNRANGNPKSCIRTVKSDINYDILGNISNIDEIKQSIININTIQQKLIHELKRKKLEACDLQIYSNDAKEDAAKRAAAKAEISRAPLTIVEQQLITEQVRQTYLDNSQLWTQADEKISILLSAATDNAKELILSKINAGQQMADIYIHLLILGYNIDDIVAFMTSPSMKIISPLLAGNIFDNTNFNSFRLVNIIDGKIQKDITALFKLDQMQEFLDSALQEKVKNETLTNSDIVEFILRLAPDKDATIQNIRNVAFSYGTLKQQPKDELALLLNIGQQLNDYKTDPDEFIKDLHEFSEIQSQAKEMHNLGTLFGLAKGITPVYTDQIQKIAVIENIFNNAVKYFGEKGLFVSTKNIQDSDRESKCLSEIMSRHGNWTEYGSQYVQNYIKKAIDLGILVWSSESEDKSYKGMFDFQKFMSDDNYRDVATHIYDFVKKQYNIFDIVSRIDQYWQAMRGWYLSSKISELASVKSNIVLTIKRELQFRDAPFKEYEIRKATDYANELMIVKWLKQRTDTPFKFIVPKGQYIYDDNMDKHVAQVDTEIILNDGKSIRTFKLWMENFLIPSLRNSSNGSFNIGGNTVFTDKENMFLKLLQYSVDNGLIYKKLDFNLSGNITSQHKALQMQELMDAFDRLDFINRGLPFRISDYFMMYNLIVNKNNPGNDRLTNLFSSNIRKGRTLLNDYTDFEAKEDQKLKVHGSEDIKEYLYKNFSFNLEDVKFKLAKQYSSNSYSHNGELVILERDSDGNVTPKQRKKNYGSLSTYESIQNNIAFEFLNTDSETQKRRLANYTQDGVFFNLNSEKYNTMLQLINSQNVEDLVKVLALMERRRQLVIDYNCK